MIEIRIHGRGGQGNVVAAYLLAIAAIKQGRFGQAFPAFGAERRGAPVQAFVRIADRPVRQRSQVRTPAFLIVQDKALVQVPGVTDGLREDGAILVNSGDEASALSDSLGARTGTLNATALALEHLGRPVPNTALIAAFLTLTGILPVEALKMALEDRFSGKVLERNLALIDAAAGQVEAGAWQEVGHG